MHISDKLELVKSSMKSSSIGLTFSSSEASLCESQVNSYSFYVRLRGCYVQCQIY